MNPGIVHEVALCCLHPARTGGLQSASHVFVGSELWMSVHLFHGVFWLEFSLHLHVLLTGPQPVLLVQSHLCSRLQQRFMTEVQNRSFQVELRSWCFSASGKGPLNLSGMFSFVLGTVEHCCNHLNCVEPLVRDAKAAAFGTFGARLTSMRLGCRRVQAQQCLQHPCCLPCHNPAFQNRCPATSMCREPVEHVS